MNLNYVRIGTVNGGFVLVIKLKLKMKDVCVVLHQCSSFAYLIGSIVKAPLVSWTGPFWILAITLSLRPAF
uniref:Uncharacterized protein n=1 Tax=Anguilla anguilla TaxID=7936 RepID=A0A0E9XEG3_ANGAN